MRGVRILLNFIKIIGSKSKSQIIKRALDDEMLEALEELLIASDMGVETAVRVTANLAEGNMGRRLSTKEVKGLLANQIAEIMDINYQSVVNILHKAIKNLKEEVSILNLFK